MVGDSLVAQWLVSLMGQGRIPGQETKIERIHMSMFPLFLGFPFHLGKTEL